MYNKIKGDIENAIGKIKWFSTLLSERTRIEIEVFKLLYKSEELKKRREELMIRLGEHVYKRWDKIRNIYTDMEMKEIIDEIKSIEPEIKETLDKASEISKIVA